MNAAVITQFPDRHLRGGNAETLRCAAERIEGSLPASPNRSRSDPRRSPAGRRVPDPTQSKSPTAMSMRPIGYAVD